MYPHRCVFYIRAVVISVSLVVHSIALLCMRDLALTKSAVGFLLCIGGKLKDNVIGKFIAKILRRCPMSGAYLNLSTFIPFSFASSLPFLQFPKVFPSFRLHASSSSSLQVLSLYQVSFRTLARSHQWPSRPKPRGNHSGLCLSVGDLEPLLGLPPKAATKAAYIGSRGVRLLPDDESVDITGLFSSLCHSCVGSMFGE